MRTLRKVWQWLRDGYFLAAGRPLSGRGGGDGWILFSALLALGAAALVCAFFLALSCGPVQLPPVNDPGDDPSALPAPAINRVNPYARTLQDGGCE